MSAFLKQLQRFDLTSTLVGVLKLKLPLNTYKQNVEGRLRNYPITLLCICVPEVGNKSPSTHSENRLSNTKYPNSRSHHPFKRGLKSPFPRCGYQHQCWYHDL